MQTQNDIRGTVPLVKLFAERQQQSHEMSPRNESPRKIRLASSLRQTYVCFQSSFCGTACIFPSDSDKLEIPSLPQNSRLMDDRGTHARKKGPLFYVNSPRSREEKQGWGNPGNGQVVDPAIRIRPGHLGQAFILTCTYFSRTSEQTRTVAGQSPEGNACV
jgi:hypothetical protein